MAVSKPPEGSEKYVGLILEALKIEKDEARRRVVSQASHIIDAMHGDVPDVQCLPSSLSDELASAPDVIPALVRTSVMRMASSDDGDTKYWEMKTVGNIGEYYSRLFPNERTATVFNAGFYAGVLAVKAGILNPELFHADSERIQLPDQE